MKTTGTPVLISTLTPELFAEKLVQEIASEKNSDETKKHLDFISTLYHLGKTDLYELKFVVEAILQGWSGENVSIIKPKESFVQLMNTLISDAEEYRSVTNTPSYEEVLMWYDRKIPFVPESIVSKARRLLEAVEYFADKG